MVDFQKALADQNRSRAFHATELGKLFQASQNATIAYWVRDSDDRTSDKRLRELDVAMKKANKALIDKLMELAGV